MCNKTICYCFHLSNFHVYFSLVNKSCASFGSLLCSVPIFKVEMFLHFPKMVTLFPVWLSLLWIEFIIEFLWKQHTQKGPYTHVNQTLGRKRRFQNVNTHISNQFIYLFRCDFLCKFITTNFWKWTAFFLAKLSLNWNAVEQIHFDLFVAKRKHSEVKAKWIPKIMNI